MYFSSFWCLPFTSRLNEFHFSVEYCRKIAASGQHWLEQSSPEYIAVKGENITVVKKEITFLCASPAMLFWPTQVLRSWVLTQAWQGSGSSCIPIHSAASSSLFLFFTIIFHFRKQ